MTVLHLHHYRATADQITAADRIAEAVSAARAILRGAARHDDAALTEACRVLQTWGDQIDYLEADVVIASIERKRRSRIKRAERRIALPLAIADVIGFAFFVVAILVVGLAA